MRTFTEAEIKMRLAAELPTWALSEGAIQRVYAFDNFKSTVMAFNAIAYLAEAANHHPDLTASYSRLGVRLSTHDIGGIGDKDFALAGQIEALLGGARP